MSTFTKHEHGAWCHPSADGCPDEIPAPPLTADERARVAAFDAAPQLPESSPIVRAVLALAEELKREGAAPEAPGDWDEGYADAQANTADRIRTTVAAVLAADPEPRDAVIERMARAMWTTGLRPSPYGRTPWEQLSEATREDYHRLAAAALDASRGGTA